MTLPVYEPPTDVAFAEPFWAAIERGELALPKCSVCGRWQWYPDQAGVDCPGAELVWETLPGTGTVYTWTRVHRPFLPDRPPGDPFIIALIDLDGAEGPRLVGNLADSETPEIGMRVSVGFQKVGSHSHPVFTAVS